MFCILELQIYLNNFLYWIEDIYLIASEQSENIVESVLAFWGSEIFENPASKNNE